ncbi:hypothetical protein F5B17DRAFT_451117 [Nemania serpens]|nr:hypothetical protein F5B17DRAFT_451117 [Nemania serpens]
MSSSISRLPDSATQLISAHVVVVTPVLLVKELLDNAIDAKATSIEILVSRDTISRIEIRDDGVGIHPDDYDALGRRGYTSKLRSMEELGDVVRKTLGFRGEALASVNSMADVIITTKISTEPVAHVLQLVPNEGGILTQTSTSAPAGTTVCVTKLFGRQPVREQMAAKEAKKILDKIQELLRSYAMTRPQLKLMLKILQTPTTIWSYSPKRNATPIEAVLQLFGAEVASNCVLRRFQTICSSPDNDSSTQNPEERTKDSFTLEALLINPDADRQRILRGHYFSVDGRPINAGRGIARRLLSIYVEHLKLSTPVKNISDCFIRLSICCPPGTYDANIEPSKDEVLFCDEQAIIDAFRHLCGELYKPATVERGGLDTTNSQGHSASPMSSLGQAQLRRPLRSQTQLSIPEYTPNSPQHSPKTFPDGHCYGPKNNVNEQSQEADIAISFKAINAESSPGCQQLMSPNNWQSRAVSERNQWNVDTSVDFSERHKRSRKQQNHEIMTTTGGALNVGDHLSSRETVELTSPSETSLLNSETALRYAPVSPLTPEPPILRHIMAPPGDLDVPSSYKIAQPARLHGPQSSTVPGGPYRSPVASPSNGRPNGGIGVPPNQSHTTLRRHRHKQPPWTPPSSDKKNRHVDAPQINSALSQDTDDLGQTQISFNGTQARYRRGRAQGEVPQTQVRSKQPLSREEHDAHPNMHDMFSSARKNLHYQLSQAGDDQLTKGVHGGEPQRRHQQPSRQRQPFSILQTNTFRNNEPPQEDHEPIATTLPTGDPRVYLLRRQKSMAVAENGPNPRKLRRLKSSLLPLESITPEYHLHDLSCTTRISSAILDELVQWMRKYDEYVIHGTFSDGLDLSLADARAVEMQLQKLLAEQKENISNGGADNDQVIIDLQAILKGKSVADAHKPQP